MSLLDDVSIVVTPNGYKAGELYAVVPVPTYGAEEGANMDFSSGTSPWALNSNWSLGGVGAIADGTSNGTIWQNAVVEDNKQYIVTYTLSALAKEQLIPSNYAEKAIKKYNIDKNKPLPTAL